MARPKKMNAFFGEFVHAVMRRFHQKLQDPEWLPTEAQANVLKRLAETQTIIQKGKPLDEGAKPHTAAERSDALEKLEAAPPEGELNPVAEEDA